MEMNGMKDNSDNSINYVALLLSFVALYGFALYAGISDDVRAASVAISAPSYTPIPH